MQHNNLVTDHLTSAEAAAKNNNYVEAITHYNEAIKLDPENGEIYWQRAHVHFSKKNYNQALDDLETLLSFNPEDVELRAKTYRLAGSTYLAQEQLETAQSFLNLSVELNPEDHLVHNKLGFYYYQTRHYKQAIIEFTKALSINPNANDYVNRAITHNRLSQSDLAIADCKAALELNPNDTEAYQEMAIAYAKQGSDFIFNFKFHKTMYKEALYHCVKALQLDPNNKNARKGLEYLLRKKTNQEILASIKELPKKEALTVLKQILDKQTLIGKEFRSGKFLFMDWSKSLMRDVRQHLMFLTTEERQIKTAARLIAQGQRDPQSLFFRLPPEVGVQIASAVNETLSPEKVKKLAEENYGIPTITAKRK